MLIIYTGEGKGKTSASTGQAIRAHGQGLKVCFAQFMKSDIQAGEQKILAALLENNFFIGGKGFYRNAKEEEKHRAAALEVLNWAQEKTTQADMLVLDEALYTLGAGLISQSELQSIIDSAKQNNTHLVLSGRGLPDWLEKQADLITVMQVLKHPYESGIKAQKGIEF